MNTQLKICTTFILTLAALSSAIAQTEVTGGIFSDRTWTSSGSPYIVTGDIVVFDDVILTIESGVEVRFNDGTGMELRNAKLRAVGTEEAPIIFTSNSSTPRPGIWRGIVAKGVTDPIFTGNQITMKYCEGHYAGLFVDMDQAYHTPYIFEHCRFTLNSIALSGSIPNDHTYFMVDDCSFEGNGTAIDGINFSVRNCVFRDNSVGAYSCALVEGCTFTGHSTAIEQYGTIRNCTIAWNYLGVNGHGWGNSEVFVGNIVTDNEIGITMGTYIKGEVEFENNYLCRNRLYNVKRIPIGVANAADLSKNCWCTTDPAEIEAGIWDAKDDIQMGLVTFDPAYNCEGTTGGPSTVPNNPVISQSISYSFYPNPASDETTARLSLSADDHVSIHVLNLRGETVTVLFDESLKQGKHEIPFAIGELTAGLYFLKLTVGTHSVTQPHIILQ